MRKREMERNIYILVGFVFLLSALLSLRFLLLHELADNIRVIAPILSGIACVVTFINAYISHKKILEDNLK